MQWLRALTLLLFSLTPTLAAPPSERDIAVWVLRQGGRVILADHRRPINDVLQLPVGEVRIIGVDLVGTLIVPEDLEKLSRLAHLKELYLPGPIWNPGAGSRLDANEQLKHLAGLKTLE
jgi:hypothetical protein